MSGPVAEAAPERTGAAASRARGPGDADPGSVLLTVVPAPVAGADVVELAGVGASGLTARHARWGVDGGEVLLTGRAPFTDLSASAAFRGDGTLAGTVDVRAAVRIFGVDVAEARWSVAGWSPDAPLAVPVVTLQGTTLRIDTAAVGADVALQVDEGLAVTRDGTVAGVSLPDGTVAGGLPLEPRVVELFRDLRGWDVSGLRAHPGTAVQEAPAFVSDADLFFAPSHYGVHSPQAAALLEAAVRAALAGLVGPVDPTPPAPPPRPAPDAAAPPPAATDPVPASVPGEPTVDTAAGAGVTPEAGAAADAASADEAGSTPAEGEAPGGGAAGGAPGEAAGAGGDEAGGEGADAGGEGAGAAAEVELIMPPAPGEPGPAAAARGGAVAGGAGGAARAARDLPPADENVAAAMGAVTEPVAETAARARGALAEALGERPAPSPEIVELCDRIRTAIREQRPVDEDELLRSDPTRAAHSAGATVAGSVEGQVDQVGAGYESLGDPPAGTPALTPTPVATPSPAAPGMGVPAETAAPDPIPAEDLSLDADVEATDQRIADSGIDTRVTREIPDDPFSTVRDGRGELGEMAERTPEELAAEQTAAIESAQADMAALQQQATEALLAARAGTVGDVAGNQAAMVTGEQQTRESVSQRAQQVFDTAKTRVDGLLEPLSRTAMARWDAGLTRLSQEFHDALDRVQRWIDERHSGAVGYVVAVGDAVFGLPDWVIQEYDRAEREFGDGVCDLLLDISTDVNGVVAAAQAIIEQARDDIDAAFDAMAGQFPEWAAQERARFSGMLDGLSQQVTQAQTSFVQDVSRRALEAVAEAQREVEERRDAARGVLGRIQAAIEAFLEDPATAIINGLLTVVGIPPGAFWALVARIQHVVDDIADDPENFVNNLVAGVRQGFQQFFDNFGTHVLGGFWNWLFSGLQAPVPMPADFSPGSLFSFALQLMGVTWPRVREILVRHVGERNVEIIEAAWQVISVLIERGPQGLVEMLRERLGPEVVVQAILEAAVQYLVETLVQQVVMRVIGMLNPAGAIAQAIDLIYQVCSWIFRNAARIFQFVEAVVNGMADVVAGNIGGLANAVERSLAMLIPPVIDFLAGLLHLGGLPNEVADVITGLQAMVYQAMDAVIGFLAERGRALLRSLGLGGEDDGEDDEEDEDNDDDELGTTVRFSAAGHGHRLWFQVAGSEATLMVASVPQDVRTKVGEWRGRLGELPQDQRAATTAKLDALDAVADQADTEGDALAAQFLQAAADAGDEVEPPSDNALENRQRAMAGMLGELFTIFEGTDRTAEWLRDMATHLPPEGSSRMDPVFADWSSRLPAYTIGNEPNDPRLWSDDVFTGARSGAESLIAAQGTHRLLLPYFQSAPGDRSVDTVAFRDHVFSQAGAPHPVRRQFRLAYGDAAVDRLRAQGRANVDAATGIGPTAQARWRDKLTEITFHWDSPGGGRIAFPDQRVPDHTRYKPIIISETENGGVRTVRYSTEAGQTFTSTTDTGNGLTITVTGENLRFMSGRGVTQDSPAFTANNGFDRSHVIANEFGGTGYSAGGNLVTASSYYNQNVMRVAERQVGDAIATHASRFGLTETEVSFTMTVTVRFGALRDPAALAQVKSQPWFPGDRAGTDLDAEILQKINAGEVHADLMRVVGVTYQWTFTDPAGGSGGISIGPDLWLLMNG
jgi:hypothetical protein